MAALGVVAASWLASGCGADTHREPTPLPPEPNDCAAHEVAIADRCVAAGVPVDGCAAGFEWDPALGCVARLPDAACPPGQMALAGETVCREVAPCGEGPWGDVAIEAGAQHVDASFVGPSDGSAAAPWTTLTEALAAAPPSGQVVLAAGSYPAGVTLEQPVRIEGRCPSMVELTGTGTTAAILIFPGASGTTIRGVAITDANVGVGPAGATDVTLERLWIHDLTDPGIFAADELGPNAFVLRGSLVEAAEEAGIVLFGTTAVIEDSEVRNTRPRPSDGRGGMGIDGRPSTVSAAASELTIRRSYLHALRRVGVSLEAGPLVVEDSLVANVVAEDGGDPVGRGIFANGAGTGAGAFVTRSVVDGAVEAGIAALEAPLTVEGTSVRNVAPSPTGVGGTGISLDVTGPVAPPPAIIRQVRVVGTQTAGVFVRSAAADVEALWVSDTQPSTDGIFGVGLLVATGADGPVASIAARDVILERNHSYGLLAADVGSFDGSYVAVTDTFPEPATGLFGIGVGLAGDTLSTRHARIERSHGVGMLVVDGTASLEDIVVRDVMPEPADLIADGIVVGRFTSDTSATLVGGRITGVERAGLSLFGATVAIQDTSIQCNPIAINGEMLGGVDFAVDNLGGNDCSCDDDGATCKVLSSMLAPPQATPNAP